MAEPKRTVSVVLEAVDRTVAAFTSATARTRGLGATLQNLKIDAAAVRPEIEGMVRDLVTKTGNGEEKVFATFNQLLQLTGDYKKSLASTGLVLDVAAAKNLTLERAGVMVARAMEGDKK